MKKKILLPAAAGLSLLLLTSGCLSVGDGERTNVHPPSVGQQLVDLKKARDAGALSDEEFAAQKQKVLAGK